METTEKNNSMNAQNSFKHLTVTIIFDGNALNRDEKIAGNITAIKKLNYNGEVRSFISKYAIRHYLFETLVKSKNWSKDAKLIASGSGDKKVIQFDITQSDILNNEEMDCFGYMYTEETFTRKAPIGITKAISLYPSKQDMALYANHNLVKRSREEGQADVQPNLFNKEEHASYYKVSFTIDTDIIGVDKWIIEDYVYDHKNNALTLLIQKPKIAIIKDVSKIENDEDESDEIERYQVGQDKIIIKEGNFLKVQTKLMKKETKNKKDLLKFNEKYLKKDEKKHEDNDTQKQEDTSKNKKNKKQSTIEIKEFEELKEDNNEFYVFEIQKEPVYDENKKELKIELGLTKKINEIEEVTKDKVQNSILDKYKLEDLNGKVKIFKNSPKNHFIVVRKVADDKHIVEFLISDDEKQKRICDILSVLKNGLYAQSSGESNTIIPLVFIAATVKVPSPIFHPYIDIQKGSNGQVIGINDGLNNDWVEKVYIQRCEKVNVNIDEGNKIKIIKEWNDFLKEAGLSNCIQNTQTNEP